MTSYTETIKSLVKKGEIRFTKKWHGEDRIVKLKPFYDTHDGYEQHLKTIVNENLPIEFGKFRRYGNGIRSTISRLILCSSLQLFESPFNFLSKLSHACI